MAGKGSKFALGAVVAAAAGYVTGLLTAPKSGQQTRQDIKKRASDARIQGEKELKNLHSELRDMVAQGESKLAETKTGANKQLRAAVDQAKRQQQKAKLLLSALHDGDAEDPELNKALTQSKRAKANLAKFLKK